MQGRRHRYPAAALTALLLPLVFFAVTGPSSASYPHGAFYSAENDRILWFIQTSDLHIGARGSQDSNNLRWLVTQARNVIAPNFIIVTGDLTDSTDGNWLGLPNGPYQNEWIEYCGIVDSMVTADDYYDIPGNHEQYNDGDFSYYLSYSVQGRATHNTQASFVKNPWFGKYHFLGINTADNTGSAFSLVSPYGDHAGLDSGELSFIETEMSSHADSNLTLVFGHHPLFYTGDSQDTYVYYGLSRFLDLMNLHLAALYGYGHTHAFSEGFFIPNQGPSDGFFYFNVASLGKSSANQYTIMAIDCDGLSSKTRTIGTWPAVLITAPLDETLGTANPYTYAVPADPDNPIRALVFDPNPVSSVKYRISGGTTWFPMHQNTVNTRLWEGEWNATSLTGPQTIEVQATSSSGTGSDLIMVSLEASTPPPPPPSTPMIGAGALITGEYGTTGTRKNKITTFEAKGAFDPGDTVIIRLTMTSEGAPVSGAAVEITITGPESVTLPIVITGADGGAEVAWKTSAPNKRGLGGTLPGDYTAAVTNVAASGYEWDGQGHGKTFVVANAGTVRTNK